ncbi:hypothetical protein RB195_007927 [Necator americanus]|uniref:Unspecific monooxygenase n=1 Tax=Necator americanus TaxID=51031 RepID=A0ABR1BZK8_NECAM
MWLVRRKLPPGPLPLPFVGNLHQLGYTMFVGKKSFIEAMSKVTKDYGNVHTFWFGPIATVNICDYATAVDAMVKKGSMFSNRNIPYLFRLTRGDRGIIASNGPLWLEQRRFALHTLRNFGLGRNIIEERIMYEFEIACEELEKRLNAGESSIDPHNMFNLLVGNIINRMLFTDRFEKKDEEDFFALKKRLDKMTEDFSVFDMLINEWSVNLPLVKQRMKYLLSPFDEILDFMRGQLKQRKQDIASGAHVIEGEGADFVDAFLIEIEKHENSNVPSSFDEDWLLMSLLDLWSAGQETTMVTLDWAFSYLLLHPQFKSRLEEELLSVTKGQRPLSITDRPNTPYFNAVLNEVHRCALIIPLNIWRDTAEDTVVGSYVIPKGTPITAQISSIMTDEDYFKDKYKFNPDRYFNGSRIEQMVVPFGLGKRACPGESLAQAELYLIIGNFLLRYEVTPDPEHPPSMRAKKELGTVRIAQPFHINFKRR